MIKLGYIRGDALNVVTKIAIAASMHFIKEHNRNCNRFSVIGIDMVKGLDNAPRLRKLEFFWMQRLGTYAPYGLNFKSAAFNVY